MKKIVLANATIKNGNMGCVALCVSAIAIITRLFKEVGEECEIYLPDSGFVCSGKMSYRTGTETYSFYSCDYYLGLTVKDFVKRLRNFVTERKDYNLFFKNADYILDIGQGDSFSDIYGLNRFRRIDRIHKIAKYLHKPYCLLPQTIGPFSDVKVRKEAKRSILNSTLCLARDKQSLDYVNRQFDHNKNVCECIDVAFFLPYQTIKHESGYIHVGINVSGLLWNGGYSQNNQFGLNNNYQETIHGLINYFLKLPHVKIHLVPHVVAADRGIENDYEISYELWREYNNPNLILAPFAFGPVEIKSYISGLDFFMGARMHATIGAFSSGVPVVPMAYSRKFNGLFEETLDYHFMTDLKTQTEEGVMTTIVEAFNKRAELKEIIKNRMNTIVKEREQLLYNELRKFFEIEKL